jgi:hypothetical protein
MIKLLDLLKESQSILIPRRSSEDRQKNYIIASQKKIQQYIKNGSKGDLNLYDTPIISLPNNLNVGGNLELSFSKITSLPDNLNVKKNLILSFTPIISLPDNLSVGGNLELTGTEITSLPNNLSVGGNLKLGETPISKEYTKKQIRQMVNIKGGSIFF